MDIIKEISSQNVQTEFKNIIQSLKNEFLRFEILTTILSPDSRSPIRSREEEVHPCLIYPREYLVRNDVSTRINQGQIRGSNGITIEKTLNVNPGRGYPDGYRLKEAAKKGDRESGKKKIKKRKKDRNREMKSKRERERERRSFACGGRRADPQQWAHDRIIRRVHTFRAYV